MYLISSKIELFQAEMANKSKDGWHQLSQLKPAPYKNVNQLYEMLCIWHLICYIFLQNSLSSAEAALY